MIVIAVALSATAKTEGRVRIGLIAETQFNARRRK
jgi:hypothetical protein